MKMSESSGIKKGDLIASSKPFAYVLKSELNGYRCDYCLLRRHDLKKCTGCNFVHFCDKPCQKSAWADHKLECSSLKNVYPRIPPPHVMLIARIIRKIKRRGKEISEQVGNISRKFEDLKSHSEEIRGDRNRLEAFIAASFVLSKFLDESELPSQKDLLEIFGKVVINSVCIMDECNEIGAGLYLGPSVFDHSCNPNVAFLFSGSTLLVRSLQDFPKFEINQMFVNYVDLAAVTETRRSQLKEQYYFTCQCDKCADKHSDDLMLSVRCINGSCSQPVFPCDNICRSCGSVINVSRRNEAEEISRTLLSLNESLVDSVETDPLKVVHSLKDVVVNSRQLLHVSNIYMMKATHLLFETYDVSRNDEEALKLGLEVLPSLRLYYPNNDYILWHLKRLARIEMDLNQWRSAAKNLNEVLNFISFLYGRQCVHLPLILSMLKKCQQHLI